MEQAEVVERDATLSTAQQFLEDLILLCVKYGASISACGCCDGVHVDGDKFSLTEVEANESSASAADEDYNKLKVERKVSNTQFLDDDPLWYAIQVIEGYQMEIRATPGNNTGVSEDLVALGFCQGSLYLNAVADIRRKQARLKE